MNEQEHFEDLPVFHQQRIAQWEKVHSEVPWGAIPERNFQKFVRENGMLGPSATRRFLDLGCGAGAQAIWLAENYQIVTAIDVSKSAIARMCERVQALENKEELSSRIWALHDDVAAMPGDAFPARSFECVFDVCCLQHLSEADAIEVVRRARGWMRPRGWFWSKQMIAPFDNSLNRVDFIRLATMESIRETFAGFASVKIEMLREIVRGDKELWSVIVVAQAEG